MSGQAQSSEHSPVDDDWVVLGKLTSPYGIKGWVKVYSYTEPMTNIGNYNPVWMQHQGRRSALSFDTIKTHGKGLVAKIDGCDTREQAASYNGALVVIPKDQLEPLPDDEYYWSELIGLKVETVAGELLGYVHGLLETGSNDVLKVRGDANSIDRKERLIPYLPGQVIKSIDVNAALIKVDWDADF